MARYHPGAVRILVPLHGILAAFPLALFVAAFFSDWAYAESADMQWANFSIWLIAGGIAMAVAAGVAGIVDALMIGRAGHRRSALHAILTIVTLVTAILNAFVHSRDAWTSVVPTGIILSAVTAILVLIVSWIGYSVRAGVAA